MHLIFLRWRFAASSLRDSRTRFINIPMHITRVSISDALRDQGSAVLRGPVGHILLQDMEWCPADREDLLSIYYWESWAVLQGAYHCCFSLPGKVALLPPHDPRCSMG
jgi:hypothetical protein